MPISIRRAVQEDGAKLIELRHQLFAETSNMLWEPEEFVQTAEDESKRIARLNTRHNSLVLIAEEGSTPIGVLTAIGGEVRRLRHSTTLALGVSKSHWGRGAATQLVVQALEWAKSSALRRVELTVHTTNLRAVNVYLKCGFQVEGLRRCSLLVNGEYVNEYLMAHLIDA
jgi:RimJ/RimL family protein N-acetyltransferase